MTSLTINKEKKSSLIAAFFDSKRDALRVVDQLQNEALFSREKIDISEPNDPQIARKLEPDDQGIKKTLWATHWKLGILGAILGTITALLMIFWGPLYAQQNPYTVLVALPVFSIFIALFIAGALTLRPDHDLVLNSAQSSKHINKWAVIVHTQNSKESDAAERYMKKQSGTTVKSF